MKNIEEYLIPNILNEEFSKYKKEINEFFKKCHSDFLYGQKRDNCGVIAASFLLFMQEKNIKLERIRGEFVTDKGVFTKLDFYKEELIKMKDSGLNPNDINDRMKFVEMNNLYERQKRIPHYWNVDKNGLIIDLSGYSQFVKTGLSDNLNNSRYESIIEKKLKPNI